MLSLKFNDIGGGSMFDNAYSVWSGVKHYAESGNVVISSDLWQSKGISEVAPSWKVRVELYDMNEKLVFKGVARFRSETDAEKFLEEVYKVVEQPAIVPVSVAPKTKVKSRKPVRKPRRMGKVDTQVRGVRR